MLDEKGVGAESGCVVGGRDHLALAKQSVELTLVTDFQAEAQVHHRRLTGRPEVNGGPDGTRQCRRRLGYGNRAGRVHPPRLLGRAGVWGFAGGEPDGERQGGGNRGLELHGCVASQTSTSKMTPKPSFRTPQDGAHAVTRVTTSCSSGTSRRIVSSSSLSMRWACSRLM